MGDKLFGPIIARLQNMAINKEWHMKNRMPKNASFEERVRWHKEHNKNCTCRPGFPKKLIEEMKKRRMKKE